MPDCADLFRWVQTITPIHLPEAPIRLSHCVAVVDPAKWLAKVQEEARRAPAGARFRSGVLASEVESIYQLVEGKNKW